MKTGTLSATMKCTETQFLSIPYRGRVFNREVLLTVQGRQSMCLRCNKHGHHRATCPETEERRRTYAQMARLEPSETGSAASVPTVPESGSMIRSTDTCNSLTMDSVDQGILRSSAKFYFPDGVPDNPRSCIICLLKDVVEPGDITAIFRLDSGGSWFCTFSSEDVASTVIQSDFSTLDTKLIVSRADKRTVLLKVLWLPMWIKLPTVELFLE